MSQNFAVLDCNLIDTALSKTASSENASYPATNVWDLSRRKRVWRSAGYWNITSSTNVFIFQESIGVNLTATVTADEYATDALFLTALAAAFNGATGKVGTYTATRDATTNRIKITQSVSGGAAVFRLISTSASSTIAALLGYDTAADYTGATAYIAEILKIHTSEHLRWDMGFPVVMNAVIAVADRGRPLRITPSATVKIKGNLTNDFVTPLVSVTCTVLDYILGYVDLDGLGSAVACRYWELEIVDPSNPYGYVELGAIFAGTKATITRGSPVFPLEVNDEDLSQRAYSEGGQTNTGRRSKYESFTLNWGGLDKASYEELQSVFETYGIHSSFFICIDQGGAVGTDPLLWTRLVKFTEGPKKRSDRPGLWALPWQLKEEL